MKLTAALLSTAYLSSASAAGGCYPKYINGGDYEAGSLVSETLNEVVPCSKTTNDSDCGSDDTKTVQETRNYECTSSANSAYCGNGGYKPGGLHSGIAWIKRAVCDPTATPAATEAPQAPSEWDNSGCPGEYAPGTEYEASDLVSVASDEGDWSMVYQCKEHPTSLFCGKEGYDPEGDHGSQAWTVLGSCTGTIAPTSSPSYDAASDTGCPEAWEEGAEYAAGDRVSLGDDGADRAVVYKCKAEPLNQFCGVKGFEPDGFHGKDAWEEEGFCSGTISPTSSPVYESLATADVGGCPREWEEGGIDKYAKGDAVSVDGFAFECKDWPFSAHCGNEAYKPKPLSDYELWREAWEVLGWCSGTISPTSSPSFDADLSVGGCPPEWSEGTDYEEGDGAAVVLSDAPERKAAYRCKGWPLNAYCGQYSPDEEVGGSLGWEYAGSCEGTSTPTSSPSFDKLTEVAGGCPEEYDEDSDEYEAGDLVAVVVSDAPSRKVVYECRSFPNSAYCKQANFAPGGEHSNMGWTLEGSCDGTMSPTPSPSAYDGTCTYDKPVTNTESCTCGESGCPTPLGKSSDDTDCEKEVEDTEVTTVEPYSSSEKYAEGDVVRLGTDRFKCKPWPFYLWCSNDVYAPSDDGEGMWREAWSEDGECSY